MAGNESEVVLKFRTTGEVQFAQTTRELNKLMNEAAQKYRVQMSAMGKNATTTDKLTATKKKLERQLEAGQKRTQMLRAEYEKSVEATGAYSNESLKLHSQLSKSETAENNLKKALDQTNQELKKQGVYSDELKAKLNKMSETGEKISSVGKSLTMKVTAPIVGAGAASVKAASDFESSFAGVKKTVDEVVDKNGKTIISYNDLEKSIRDMAKEIPASTSEINEVAEAAGQLGIQTENVMGFTRTMIDMGESTNMSSEEAATSLAKLANITGMSQKDFDKLGSAIVNLGNNSATTEKDIVAMSLRLAGSAKQANMSEDQILGMAAAMSSVGINAEAGGGSMSRVMQKIQTSVLSGNDQLQLFAQTAGMSANEFKQAWQEDAASALTEFVKGLGKAKDSGDDVTSALKKMGINSTQEIDTMLRLSGAGETLSESLGISSEGWKENSALTSEAEKRYDTFQSKLQIVKNKLEDVMITIGTPLMEALSGMIDGMQPALDVVANIANWFASLDKNQQKTIMTIIALIAAVGPFLVIFGKTVVLIANVTKAFKTLQVAMALLNFNPIVLAITGLIAAFVLLYTKCDWFRRGFNTFMKGIAGIGKTQIDAIKRYFGGLIDFIAGVFTGDWSRAWQGVKDIFGGIFDSFEGLAKAPLNGVIALINSVFAGLGNIKIPKWVPKIGGQNFSMAQIPYLASGGHVLNGQAIVGEAGPELLTNSNGKTTVTPLSDDEKRKGISGKYRSNVTIQQHITIGNVDANNPSDLDRMNRKMQQASEQAIFAMGGDAG